MKRCALCKLNETRVESDRERATEKRSNQSPLKLYLSRKIVSSDVVNAKIQNYCGAEDFIHLLVKLSTSLLWPAISWLTKAKGELKTD